MTDTSALELVTHTLDYKLFVDKTNQSAQIEWFNIKTFNQTLVEATLASYIGSNYAGAWILKKGEKPEMFPGTQCFTMKWNGDKLVANRKLSEE